ncbi:MAG: SDR family oxidoreductase [Chloroflexi bacterium]|nr:SDR family oxidoreductase [Chloroflexota bacterium]
MEKDVQGRWPRPEVERQRPSEDFRGKTVLVTGSGRNIGRAIVLEFAKCGANVVVNGHSKRDECEEVAGAVRKLGAKALVCMADVGDPHQVNRMVEETVTAFGGIDIYISNVGLRLNQSLDEISYEDWDIIIRTNLSAAFYLAKAIVPHMRKRGWGRIIHMSGMDGFMGAPVDMALDSPKHIHNVTCKSGLHGLTKSLAKEEGRHGITVNTVDPGAILTSRLAAHFPNWSATPWVVRSAVKRVGEPEEVAWLCCYLASEKAGFITGQVVHINGGYVMY